MSDYNIEKESTLHLARRYPEEVMAILRDPGRLRAVAALEEALAELDEKEEEEEEG